MASGFSKEELLECLKARLTIAWYSEDRSRGYTHPAIGLAFSMQYGKMLWYPVACHLVEEL
jgi:hypothetical protein